MSHDRTPEQHLAEVALTALSEGLLHALQHDNQFHELRRSEFQLLAGQLDQLLRWAFEHSEIAGPPLAIDGRKLASVATAPRLLSNGGITGIVRRIAATLQREQ